MSTNATPVAAPDSARAVTCSRGRTITEADIVMFATLTGDWHPQHTDAEWCKSALFGERVAHGMLVTAFAAGLVTIDHAHVVALRRADAVFKRPVKIGDTIRVEHRVSHRTALDDHYSLVTWDWRIVNQQRRCVAKATVDVVWRNETVGNGHLEVSELVEEAAR